MSTQRPDIGAVPAGGPAARPAASGGQSTGGGPPVGSEPPEELLDRSLPELIKQLADQSTTLIRQEVELAKVETREAIDIAKAEMTEKAKDAGKGVGMLGGAAVVAFLAAIAFTAFLILILGTFLPTWLAALIVTLIYVAVAAVLAQQGKKQLQQIKPLPEKTIETVKEDVEWAKTQTRFEKK